LTRLDLLISLALEIIHNVPDFLLEYNTRDTTYKRYKLEDTLDLDELVFNSHAKKDLSSRKPSMSKVYLNNITVMTGRSVQFKCPSVFDPSFTNDIISNDETKINEYLQIKTVSSIQEFKRGEAFKKVSYINPIYEFDAKISPHPHINLIALRKVFCF